MFFCNPASGPTASPLPSSAPPAPPPDGSEPFPLRAVNLEEFSYTNAYGSDGRPTLVPNTSEDYGLSGSFFVDSQNSGSTEPPLSFGNNRRMITGDGAIDGSNLPNMRGDASIRPNTGNSNQSAGDPLGSLQEITSFLRWTTIATTGAAIVWEGFSFPLRLIGSFLTDPAQVVLGVYLGFFCLLIFSAEFNNKSLMDNFGFLYYPLSRGFVLLMMGGMCLGILDQWWESLLGLAFGAVGIGYIYTYIKYPEYRRWQHYNERMPTAWQEAKMYWSGEAAIPTASWATPTATQTAMGFANETQSLLHTV